MPETVAIVLAGGSGTRIQRPENKVYLPVGDRLLLAYPLEQFDRSPLIDRIVLVVRPGDRAKVDELLEQSPVAKLGDVVDGGETRHASEFAGLSELAPQIDAGQIGVVCIHDAARPFMSLDLLERVVVTARRHGGAVPALPIDAEMLLRSSADGDLEPLPTGDLRRVQTPQGFRAGPLLTAYRRADAEGFQGADTAECVQRFGQLEIRTVPGEQENLKVTYVEDLLIADELAEAWTG